MAKVHPTAVVQAGAQLDADVVVGPYCFVGADVSIGADTVLQAHVTVTGRVTIGKGNHLYPQCTIGGCPQVLGLTADDAGRLVIGDRNTIHENVTIHPSRRRDGQTTIGNDNFIMINTHIGHDCVLEDKIVTSNLVQIAGHCKIETGAWLSGLVASHQFVTIGKWGFMAGLAGLNRDTPPFMTVSGHYPPTVRGVNKRGMVRAGLTSQQQEAIEDAYKRLYRQGGALLENASKLAQEDGLDENVRAIVDSIQRSGQHRFGRYRETLRQD